MSAEKLSPGNNKVPLNVSEPKNDSVFYVLAKGLSQDRCNTHVTPVLHSLGKSLYRNTLQHTATHCNSLYHTATQCITLHHTRNTRVTPALHSLDKSLYCNTLQHTATHCTKLQHTATHCNTHVTPALNSLGKSFDIIIRVT